MILRGHALATLRTKNSPMRSAYPPKPPLPLSPTAATKAPRIVGVSLLRDVLAKLYLAAEAMSIDVRDIRLDDFDADDRKRWTDQADAHVRRWINGEEP